MSGIKNVITIILRGAVFLTILSVTILTLNNALKVRQDNGLPEEYYDYAKDTFDVVFLGTSVMMDAVQPMELYRDYGIVGYNLASGNQSMGMSYYLAKEVIEKDHPSLIVLDCSRSVRNEKDTYLPFMHYVTDCMPLLSRNRIRMITELRDRDEWKELMLPLIAYHSRWNDFERPSSHVGIRAAMYGGQGLVNTKSIDPFDEPSYVEDAMKDSARIYLEKLVGLCRETDTSLLLVSMPIPGQNRFFDQDGYNKRWSATQDVADFARKNDVEYMNYLADAEELGLDLNLETDCSDGEHLNRWGAEKLTRLLGRHLQEKYGLPDRRGEDGVYQRVREDFAKYPARRMQSCLQYASSLHRITDVLAVDAHDQPVEDVLVIFALNGEISPKRLSEENAVRMQRCGITADLHAWEDHAWLAVIDGGKVVYQTAPEGTGGKPETVEGDAGVLHYSVTSGRLNEETGEFEDDASITVNRLGYTTSEKGIFFAAFDKTTGELLDNSRIDMNTGNLEAVHLN